MDIRAIRRHNLTRLILEAGGQRALAATAGVSAGYLSQVLSERVNRNVGHNLARRLEEGMGKPYGWMDVIDPATQPGSGNTVREGYAFVDGYGIVSPRRKRLRMLVLEAGGVVPLARQARVSLPFLQQVVQGDVLRWISSCLARRLEVAMDRPKGWMDASPPQMAMV